MLTTKLEAFLKDSGSQKGLRLRLDSGDFRINQFIIAAYGFFQKYDFLQIYDIYVAKDFFHIQSHNCLSISTVCVYERQSYNEKI